jgi:hypothetical protein
MSATNTSRTFLMVKNASTYEKLVDINDFPDLGGDPEMLETTTLSDIQQTFILGIQSSDALSFNANYDPDTYSKLKESEGTDKELSVWFGGEVQSNGNVTPTGAQGKFDFTGQYSVHVTGGGTNEVRKMAVTVAPSSAISFNKA